MPNSRATHARTSWVLLALLATFCCDAVPPARADDGARVHRHWLASRYCPRCALMIGVGATYWPWRWTDGIVAPIMLEVDQSRWELGAFRFATAQYLKFNRYPPSTISAHPYWGFSAMRRWQVLHRSRWKLYLGFGAVYRSETDLLEPIRWNFAYLVSLRYALRRNTFLEFSVRHWSDAWLKNPNRGQNFLLLSVGFH